jgi:hypothetical protein
MDNLKLKAIEYFAAKPHDDVKANAYLKNEYKRVHSILTDSTSFESMSSACETLDKFISHVADDAIEDLVLCWERLHNADVLIKPSEHLSKYHTKEGLYTKLINLLSRLVYIEQDKVVPILFKFWKDDEATKDDVEKVFKELAEFNLYAVEKIGFTPQFKLLHTIMKFSDEEKIDFFPIVSTVYSQILSTEIEGHSWEYRTVSIKSMAIPASVEIEKLRNDTVDSLKTLYQTTEVLEHKKELLNVMNNARRVWSRAQISEAAKLMVENNTITVLQFWASIVNSELMELVQKIEHFSYWTYFHASSEVVKKAALNVEEAIERNEEYVIYRDLVGFEGIFGGWEEERNSKTDYDKQRKKREERIDVHIKSVTHDNIAEWLNRVELYLMTDSRDLATFPELFKFVEIISRRFPNAVLSQFLESEKLDKSASSIFRGLWASSIRAEFIGVVTNWIENAKYLWELSVAFISFDDVDLAMIDTYVDKAVLVEDSISLSSFIRVFDARREYMPDEFINQQFIKTFAFFNLKQTSIWVNSVWFVPKGESFIQMLTKESLQLMVENLVFVNNIDHRVEGILEQIAQTNVIDVFYLFDQRISFEKQHERTSEERYEAIPYSFYSIHKVIAEHPTELISLIKRNYEYQYGVHAYGVAAIFQKCFSPFQPQLIDLILAHLNPTIEKEMNVILAIITRYEGHSSVLPLLKRLVTAVTLDDEGVRLFNSTLLSTGVVSGEYGFVDAYKNKQADIESWLSDENPRVVAFACQYKELLGRMIEDETKRVDEFVALEKHRYGADD